MDEISSHIHPAVMTLTTRSTVQLIYPVIFVLLPMGANHTVSYLSKRTSKHGVGASGAIRMLLLAVSPCINYCLMLRVSLSRLLLQPLYSSSEPEPCCICIWRRAQQVSTSAPQVGLLNYSVESYQFIILSGQWSNIWDAERGWGQTLSEN